MDAAGGRPGFDPNALFPPCPKLTLDCEVFGGLLNSGRKPFVNVEVVVAIESELDESLGPA